MITIAAGPDDLVNARMPALAERRALGILAPDVPVLSLKRPGQAEDLFVRPRANMPLPALGSGT